MQAKRRDNITMVVVVFTVMCIIGVAIIETWFIEYMLSASNRRDWK